MVNYLISEEPWISLSSLPGHQVKSLWFPQWSVEQMLSAPLQMMKGIPLIIILL